MELKTGHAELKTALVGIDGENGIRGYTKENRDAITRFVAQYDRDREEARKERKSTNRWTIGTAIAVAGLAITTIATFVLR